MTYAPPDFETIRDDALTIYRGLVNGADISEDSEIYARASVAAAVAAQICYGVKYTENQIFPDTADSGNLERHAGLYGLSRKEPTISTGTVRLTGTNGTVVAAGLTLLHEDGTEFITTSGGTIAGGLLDVTVDSVTPGSIANKSDGDELDVQTPPSGVDSTATAEGDLTGGTDEETDEALIARVLNRMQMGNAGGTANDYEQWALEVAGVLQADCLPLRLGPGCVSVAVYTAGPSGWRSAAGAPLRAAVLAALNIQRPVTASVDVPTVTELATAVTVAILEYEDGYDEASVRAAVEDAIESFIYGLITGETLYRSQLGRAISAVAGVLDYSLTVPAANVAATVDGTTVQIHTPGAITVT